MRFVPFDPELKSGPVMVQKTNYITTVCSLVSRFSAAQIERAAPSRRPVGPWARTYPGMAGWSG